MPDATYASGKILAGQDVPDSPPFDYGLFQSLWCWQAFLKVSTINSALRAGAIEARRLGPRGGQRFV